MTKQPSRVAAIHDLSGFGRCSLSVILPVLSVMGIQPIPIPTAILSTHTGGFGEVTSRDLTDYLAPTLAHYSTLNLNFDCVYSGFLNSEQQVDLTLDFLHHYSDALAVIDPVMGDHGKPYRTFTKSLCARMRDLVCQADIITPNLTEAYILLDQPYHKESLLVQDARSLLIKLGALGPKWVIITGVVLHGSDTLSNIGYDRENSRFWRVDCDYIPVSYPGTGDIFASVFTGGILNSDSFPMAIERATRFLELTIKTTFSYGTDTREGVMLEKTLKWLTEDNLLMGYHPL